MPIACHVRSSGPSARRVRARGFRVAGRHLDCGEVAEHDGALFLLGRAERVEDVLEAGLDAPWAALTQIVN
ncbi:hypothetical protein [Streptomyces griseoviridis]|uniref:Uncharacterized protein n=2 Tax=Streptomyces TaxID=1883 RepID=A0A918LIE9_STRGD|nr:hypothetical protein GCM10010238_49110 [Streptomyces niveoruber]GGU46350.1 hypothetical protein GCM10010259_41460 [Streptomyces daghestanicus]GHI33579.1 hypothetical protein Sdagh_53090 [Streptomyces daghestanicus]